RGDVERRRELDVAYVVPPEIHVHQARDELVVGRVFVVLHSLQQRVGAVADADERHAHAVVGARLPVLLAVLLGHWGPPYRIPAICRTIAGLRYGPTAGRKAQ